MLFSGAKPARTSLSHYPTRTLLLRSFQVKLGQGQLYVFVCLCVSVCILMCAPIVYVSILHEIMKWETFTKNAVKETSQKVNSACLKRNVFRWPRLTLTLTLASVYRRTTCSLIGEVRLEKRPKSRCQKLTRPMANARYWVFVIWVMTWPDEQGHISETQNHRDLTFSVDIEKG